MGIKNTSKDVIKTSSRFDLFGWITLSILIVITIVTFPRDWRNVSHISIQHVWFYGWITAISTGMGVIPFLFVSEPSKFWMGISNGLAGGMMLAASYSLTYEGATFTDDQISINEISSIERTIYGFIAGIIFIIVTKKILDQFEDLKLGDMRRVDTEKMILIVFVMTLHSITEGIGVGVSFGGKSGLQLGQFISLSLAVHNIPEGLAVVLVLTEKKVSILRSGLWAIFTSIPQPLMAIPAYMFVEKFVPYLPVGLGFAAGAMSYVAIFELIVEALQDTSILVTGTVSSLSCLLMMVIQQTVKVSI